ncbi:MAG: type II secretion system protein [Pirellula sp.]
MRSLFFSRAKRGFTLVELLVVIAIIGILLLSQSLGFWLACCCQQCNRHVQRLDACNAAIT